MRFCWHRYWKWMGEDRVSSSAEGEALLWKECRKCGKRKNLKWVVI